MSDLAAQINALPQEQRAAVRDALNRELLGALVADVLSDPEAVSLKTLASVYKSMARGSLALGGAIFRPRTERDEHPKADRMRAEMVRRIKLLRDIGDDPDKQAAALAKAEADPVDLFRDWLWMLDPRDLELCPYQPFYPMAFQEEVIGWIGERYAAQESGLIKKSRDMGLSVICVGFGFHLWLFKEGAIVGYGSRKESLVHKIDDFDSLLEKPKIFLDYLPAWMVPSRYQERKHYNHLNIKNPNNGAQLKGEGGEQLGRAGRASLYFADEFSYIRHQESTVQSLSGTTECAIYLGTSAGPNTHMSKMERLRVYPTLVLHWTLDRRKLDRDEDVGIPSATSAWESAKRRELKGNPHAFAREYECDDSKALAGLTIPLEWIQAAVGLGLDDGTDAAVRVAGLDLAVSEKRDESAFCVRVDATASIEAWRGHSIEQTAERVIPLAVARGVQQLNFDRGGIGSGFAGAAAKVEGWQSLRIVGVSFGERATNQRYPDAPKLVARKRFANHITELWWSLRLRFKATWEMVTKGVDHAPEDCISIPNDEILIRQLSNRPYEEDARGRIKIIDKRELAESPDRADALALCEARYKGGPRGRRR